MLRRTGEVKAWRDSPERYSRLGGRAEGAGRGKPNPVTTDRRAYWINKIKVISAMLGIDVVSVRLDERS